MKNFYFLLFSLFCSTVLRAQTKPDIVIFDEDDAAGTGYYDASWSYASAPSTLTRGGSGNDKLLIESSLSYTGTQCGRIEWNSGAGGDWGMFISSVNWTTQDASGYDSLVLYLNSRDSISSAELPQVSMESSANQKTAFIALGTFLSSGTDGDSATWQRISIPLTAFEPFNSFSLSQFKDVNFKQNAADNVTHTLWVDNIRIVSVLNAPDTTTPVRPLNVVSRFGDKSIVLHWDLITDQVLDGYSIYRSENTSGPFSKINAASIQLPSFADMNVVNGQQYYYFVRAVNSSQVESESSDTVAVSPKAFADDNEFLDYLQHTSFDFFWYEANPQTGLIKDRNTPGSPASIASVGFGLTAIGVGVDHGWITREAGKDRTLITLKTFWNGKQGTPPIGMAGYKGWFYHFLNMSAVSREWNCELSSIDTGLLLAGILYSKQYFDGVDSTETQIRALADSIFNRVDWNWMRNNASSLTMGWNPESGFLGARWIGYNEAMILYIMGIGAQTDPLPANTWSSWTGGYQWFYNNWLGDFFVNFPPLFGHQYSHSWVDFRNIADTYMKSKNITYFENSRRATIANRKYCIDNPKSFLGYGDNVWGLTACDGPAPAGYNARGLNSNDDGTIAPTAAGGSIAFTPELSIPALRYMYDQYREQLWTGYGFRDAFNVTVNWWGPDVIGIDEGPIVLMIENYRTGNVWKTFMKEKIITDGLSRIGFTTVTDVAENNSPFPREYSLEQNFPNPFNPTTMVAYSVPEASIVTLRVYDALGREVETLVNEKKEAGRYSVQFTADHLSSGVYFYRITAGNFVQTKKMTVLR